MDSNSSGGNPYVFDSGDLYPGNPGAVLPLVVKNNMEDHSNMEPDDPWPNLDAHESSALYIPPVGSVPSKLWGVRTGYLLCFIAGIIFSFIIQLGLAILLIGP